MPSAKINALLSERPGHHTPLQRLLRQAADQEAWTLELCAVLPENLRYACQAKAVRGNALVVVCRDSAVATRLRLLAPTIADKLRALPHFSHIDQLRVKVSPD